MKEQIFLFLLLIAAIADGLYGIKLFTDAYTSTTTYIIYGIVSAIIIFLTWVTTYEKKTIKVVKKY